MRLCDLARAIDDALFDACIMYDKTLVVGAGATYIAGSMSYDLFYCRSKSLYEGRCLAYPCGAGSVTLNIFVAKTWLCSGPSLQQVTYLAACFVQVFSQN